MDNTLGSIFSEEQTAPEPERVEVAPEPEQQEPEAEVTGEQAAPPAAPQEDPIEKHRKGLEAAALAERRRRQEIEQEFAQFKAQVTAQQKQAEPEAPDANQYTDTAAYLRDVARYEATQAFREQQQQAQQVEMQRREMAQQQAFAAKADESVAMGQAKYPDFDAAINTGLAPFLNPDLQRALVLSRDGHDVAYFLAKNPAETARIASLSPLEMAMEIGELRSRVKAPPKVEIPQTLTQARDSRGQFKPNSYTGPTPLDDILTRR
jgi:hypothetical protein